MSGRARGRDAGGAGGAAAGIILGVAGGIALAALLSLVLRRRHTCPVCDEPIEYGVNPCPHCRTALRWN